MQLFLKENFMKVILAIFAWGISIIVWFFPSLLTVTNNSTNHTYNVSSMVSFILAVALSYSVIKSFKRYKTK